MTGYEVALFIHLLGAVIIFLAIGISQLGGARVRRAETVEHIRLWLGLVRTTQRMWPVAILFLLGAGVYMTIDVWSFSTPWVVGGLIGLAVMVATGVAVVSRGFERIATAAEDRDGPPTADLRRLIGDPRMWVVLSANNGIGIGVVWLMASKPGWLATIVVLVAAALIGGISGYAAVTRSGQAAGAPVD